MDDPDAKTISSLSEIREYIVLVSGYFFST